MPLSGPFTQRSLEYRKRLVDVSHTCLAYPFYLFEVLFLLDVRMYMNIMKLIWRRVPTHTLYTARRYRCPNVVIHQTSDAASFKSQNLRALRFILKSN